MPILFANGLFIVVTHEHNHTGFNSKYWTKEHSMEVLNLHCDLDPEHSTPIFHMTLSDL